MARSQIQRVFPVFRPHLIDSLEKPLHFHGFYRRAKKIKLDHRVIGEVYEHDAGGAIEGPPPVDLLEPVPSADLRAYEVSSKVNRATTDSRQRSWHRSRYSFARLPRDNEKEPGDTGSRVEMN